MKGGHGRAHAADEVRDDSRHQAGEEDRVLDVAEVEDFDAEESARHGSAEDGGEAGADPADHEASSVFVLEVKHVGEETRDRRADLRARPLLANRPAESERDHRGQQLDGRHQPVDPTRAPVDGRDDGLCPVAPRRRGERAYQPNADNQGERQ